MTRVSNGSWNVRLMQRGTLRVSYRNLKHSEQPFRFQTPGGVFRAVKLKGVGSRFRGMAFLYSQHGSRETDSRPHSTATRFEVDELTRLCKSVLVECPPALRLCL